LIQRVGRVDRVDTKHRQLITYNVFPSEQGNNEIKLRESAESKIAAIIELLGNDAKLLTEDESIRSNELFRKIQDKRTITGEDENEQSELEFLEIIKILREKDISEFARIRDLPLKLRVARKQDKKLSGKLTAFLKKGEENSFVITDKLTSEKIGFFEAASILHAVKSEESLAMSDEFYALLQKAKMYIRETDMILKDSQETTGHRGLTYAVKIQKRLRAVEGKERLTIEQKEAMDALKDCSLMQITKLKGLQIFMLLEILVS
jgi:hypothetical protein